MRMEAVFYDVELKSKKLLVRSKAEGITAGRKRINGRCKRSLRKERANDSISVHA